MKKSLLAFGIGAVLLLHFQLVWSDEGKPDPAKPVETKAAAPEKPAEEEKKPAEPKPDPSGANYGPGIIGDLPPTPTKAQELDEGDKEHNKHIDLTGKLADAIQVNRAAINMMWTLLTGFLVMFMQAGFAMVETGLTRAKNVAHTMAMNFMVYGLGMMGFWICGFALMFGNYGSIFGNDASLLNGEFSIKLFGKEFGLFGYRGFFLAGRAYDSAIMTLFLFQMVFMDTTATIPTGTMAERWKFLPFVIYGFFVSMIIYPIYGNWVWGGGWLAKLGANFGLGHGHVDFAGSSVVHMTGGVTALAGGLIIGARIGKYNRDGSVNVLPAHNVPMYIIGTFILAFGWFGFNPGSTLAGADMNIGRIACNTLLASGAGAITAMIYMWLVYKKPDPSFLCNGMLAGLVAITAPCAFVPPWAAVLIGGIAGVLVIWSCLFWERVVKVDDPVGAISVHGVNGAWGILAVGLFADGSYLPISGYNGSYWYKLADGTLKWSDTKLTNLPDGAVETGVTGLFYGNPSQLGAEAIGILANIVWVFCVAYAFFWVIEKLMGNRVSPEVELQGLDIPEMGVLGYINEDPKVPEGHLTHPSAEPRHATFPPDGMKRFALVVEGLDSSTLSGIWAALCQPGPQAPSPAFLEVYPYMTTLQGNRFRFRGGDAEALRDSMERLLQPYTKGPPVRVRVER